MINRNCTCGATANGVSLPELLSEGWKAWYYPTETYLTCPDCSVTIEQLEFAVRHATPATINMFNERKL